MALLNFTNPATKFKWFNLAWLLSLLVFPVLLYLMPSVFFDHTGFELCPSKAFFNVECPGCGMTRAVMHMHHLEWDEAIYYNYGIVLIYPGLILVWFYWLGKAIKRHKNFSVKQI